MLIWFASAWSFASAQSVHELDPTSLTDEITLVSGKDVLYLNETAKVELDALSAWSQRGRFKLYGKEAIDFGYLARPVWVTFRVKNGSSSVQAGVISIGRAELKVAEIHMVGGSGPELLYSRKTDGTYTQRFRDYLALAEVIDFAPGETKTFLVRIQSSHSSALPLAVGYESAFRSATNRRLNIVFIFTTVALTIIALNVTLMLLVGQKRLLWFPLSQLVAVCGSWQVNRYFYLITDPPGREIARIIDQTLTLGAILLLVQFARVFFRTSENLPRTDRFALGLIVAGAGLLVLEFTGLMTDFYEPGFFVGPTTLVWLTCFVTLIWIAISARLNGVAGAGWIFAAWLIYGCIVTYMVIESLTVLPPLPLQSDLMVPLVALEATMITHALGLFARRNVRERESAQRELATALRRQVIALQDLAARSRLLLAMGHDGRNLLGGLNYLSDGIREASSLDDAQYYAGRLKDVSTMLDDMLNIMVDNAASGEGTHGPIVIERVNVERLLSTVRIVAGKAASKKGIPVRIHAGVEEVMTDHLRVFRILTNLVSNAGKYSNSGKILLACRRHENEIRYQVFDQGNGLSEEEVSSLLEFRPVRFDDTEPGEGVGLTICQEFAKDLGGELRVASKKGRGSVFELCLPVAAKPDSDKRFRIGVLGEREDWPRIDQRLETIELATINQAKAAELDALLIKSDVDNQWEKVSDLPLVLVASFEKTSEIRARWAGKAFALIYNPVSVEAVIAALTCAGKQPTRRIRGAEVDDANSDRRRSRPRIRGTDVEA